MKKGLMIVICAFLYMSQSITADSPISWHNARKHIIKKAEMVTGSYDETLCVWTTRMYNLILSSEFETESWEIAQRVIDEVLPQMTVYKKFIENPNDDIYLQELMLQTSMIGGQIAAQVNQNFEFGAKIGAILGEYLTLVKETLRKK